MAQMIRKKTVGKYTYKLVSGGTNNNQYGIYRTYKGGFIKAIINPIDTLFFNDEVETIFNRIGEKE